MRRVSGGPGSSPGSRVPSPLGGGVGGGGAVLEAAVADRERFRETVGTAREQFESRLKEAFPDLEINAPRDARLVQHSHVRIPGIRNETALVRLDQAGVAASAASP